MRFKDFIHESQGLFGDVKSVNSDLGFFKNQVKSCKLPKNNGIMRRSVKPSSPARPSGITSYKKPMTIPSLLK